MKLLGSTESEITKDKNGENVPHLEIAELILIHCNLVNNNYQQNSRILYTFTPDKSMVVYYKYHPQTIFFKKHLIPNFKK